MTQTRSTSSSSSSAWSTTSSGCPSWHSTAVVIMYDDSDGAYDHVMPPIVNDSQTVDDALTGPGQCGTKAPILGGYQGRCGYGPRLPLHDHLAMGARQPRRPYADRPDVGDPLRRGQLARRRADRRRAPTTPSPDHSPECSTSAATPRRRQSCSSIPPPANPSTRARADALSPLTRENPQRATDTSELPRDAARARASPLQHSSAHWTTRRLLRPRLQSRWAMPTLIDRARHPVVNSLQ